MSKDSENSSRLSRRTFIGSVGAVLTAGVACSSEESSEGAETTGGRSSSSGGYTATGTGGASQSTGGSSQSTGGASASTGGTSQSTGGTSQSTGGTSQSTGGTSQSTGGTSQSTGGTSQSTGGTSASTGGTSQSTGGTSQSTGGSSQGTGGTPENAGGAGESGGTTGEAGNTGEGGSAGSGNTATALVSMVRASGTDWATATETAIAMAGGLPDLTGLTVLLRPNVISSDPPPTTTNPEVIRGVIRAVKNRGATTIYVADDGWAASNTVDAMDSLEISAVCSAEGATPLDLKGGPTTRVDHPNAGAWPNGMNVYNAVLDADYVVNIPVCKSHSIANYTMALKAWYGHVPQTYRDHVSLAEQCAELHLAKQEGFVVLDATKAMVTGGPQSGTIAEPQIVVASRDAIAADVTGLCIHKHFGTGSGAVANLGVWEQQQVVRALELSFPGWLSQPTNFEYVSEGIDEHAEIMARRDD